MTQKTNNTTKVDEAAEAEKLRLEAEKLEAEKQIELEKQAAEAEKLRLEAEKLEAEKAKVVKYRALSFSVTGKNGTVVNSGIILDADFFVKENIEGLLKAKHIEVYNG